MPTNSARREARDVSGVDRVVARALVEAGYMPLSHYIELFAAPANTYLKEDVLSSKPELSGTPLTFASVSGAPSPT